MSGKAFLSGAIAALVLEGLVGALVVVSGVVDVAAVNAAGFQDRILGYASTRSLAHHATVEKNPVAADPAALENGLEHYRAMCVGCHGGPGTRPAEFAAGLHPAAPDLASPQVQSFTDGMLYRAISGGIGSTGMPAFGPTHEPRDIWSIVAFVRHLPALTPEEKRELARASPARAHGVSAAPSSPPSEQPPAGAQAGSAGSRVHQVTISNFKFEPATLTVHVGDVVEWKNADFVAHTATADDRGFDTGNIDAGEVKRVTAGKQGRFPYFCRYHVAMKGTLTVE